MKKLFRTVLAVAVAAAAMTSCQKAVMEEEGGINAVVSFQASFPETKTTFGTAEAGKYPVLWQDGDKVAVSVSLTNPLKDLEVTPSTDKKTGTFSKDVTLPGEGPWAFYVVSPSAAIVGANSGYKSLTLDFATDQTPTAVSVDPALLRQRLRACPWLSISRLPAAGTSILKRRTLPRDSRRMHPPTW